MPAARALSSPSGEAAEDNVVERKNLGAGRITLRITELRITDGQTDVEFEIVFYIAPIAPF